MFKKFLFIMSVIILFSLTVNYVFAEKDYFSGYRNASDKVQYISNLTDEEMFQLANQACKSKEETSWSVAVRVCRTLEERWGNIRPYDKIISEAANRSADPVWRKTLLGGTLDRYIDTWFMDEKAFNHTISGLAQIATDENDSAIVRAQAISQIHDIIFGKYAMLFHPERISTLCELDKIDKSAIRKLPLDVLNGKVQEVLDYLLPLLENQKEGKSVLREAIIISSAFVEDLDNRVVKISDEQEVRIIIPNVSKIIPALRNILNNDNYEIEVCCYTAERLAKIGDISIEHRLNELISNANNNPELKERLRGIVKLLAESQRK